MTILRVALWLCAVSLTAGFMSIYINNMNTLSLKGTINEGWATGQQYRQIQQYEPNLEQDKISWDKEVDRKCSLGEMAWYENGVVMTRVKQLWRCRERHGWMEADREDT